MVKWLVKRAWSIFDNGQVTIVKSYHGQILSLSNPTIVKIDHFQVMTQSKTLLEKVQRGASKIPTNLKDLLHEERLKILGITPLEERRTRGDLIQTYKIVNGLSGLQFVSESRTRAASYHSKRLKREAFPSKSCNDFCHFVNIRHEFLLNRVTEYWNELTNSHVNAKNINSAEAGLGSLPILATKAY